MRLNNKGFTLLEMLIVMTVFVIVLMITGSAFKTILEQSTKVFRSEESNIEGMIGLEMLRHDLQQAGLGLFTEPSPVTYSGEAASAPASNYNDYNTAGTRKEPPRPIVVGDYLASGLSYTDGSGKLNVITGTDYLAIKATTVGTSKTAQKWTYLEFAPPNVTPHTWASAAENLGTTSGDKVVLLKRQISTSAQSTTLVPDPTNDFNYAFSSSAFAQLSSSSNGVYTAYGVDNNATIRMPFNRADYFVALPAKSSGAPDPSRIPDVCAKDASGNPSTAVGVLYKATVKHDDGTLMYYPVLDCVADMQVVLGWDMSGDGAIDCYSNADGTHTSGSCISPAGGTVANALSAANNASAATKPNIRNNLKMVKVYVLAQNGRKDTGYTSPPTIVVGDSGETDLTRSYDLAANGLRNYRWKLYRIVVRPKNLFSNQ